MGAATSSSNTKACVKLQVTRRNQVVGGLLQLQGQQVDPPTQLKMPHFHKAAGGSPVILGGLSCTLPLALARCKAEHHLLSQQAAICTRLFAALLLIISGCL